MRFGKAGLLIGLSAMLAQPAFAGGWSDTCDWYQNAVLGTRCAQSWSFGVGVDFSQYNYDRSAFGYSSTGSRYDTLGSFAITPTNWLTVSFGTNFIDRDFSKTTLGVTQSSSTSFWGQQTLQANANLVDTGPGAQRFVVNAFFGGFVTPSHDQVGENGGVFGGITANGQWQIGHGMSVLAQGQLQLASQSQDSDVFLYPHARLLLSNDALGIAVGPVFNSGQWLSGNQTANSQTSNYSLGGTAIAQPFRSSDSAFLNGVILQVTGQESLGQAGWVSSSYAKTDQFDVSGTVGFHFRY